MSHRDILLSGYEQHPDLLAVDLERLLEPISEASDAVVFNLVLDKIKLLCSRVTKDKDELGIDKAEKSDFWCKSEISKRLAKIVLMYARQT